MSDASLPRVLIVDDEPMNVKVLVDLLRPNYSLIVARDAFQAIERLKTQPLPDLALIDVMMPGMTGLELCQHMRLDKRLSEVPVIFVSALGQDRDETQGFASGAVDYITKPVSPLIVQARVRTHIALHRATRELAGRNQSLEEIVAQRTEELARTQDLTVQALASLVEKRDNETSGHVVRTQRYVQSLGDELIGDPRYGPMLTKCSVALMAKAAPLHDIGKVGVPDAILHKPGRLTVDEYEVMKRHTTIGRDALAIVAGETGRGNEFLRYAIEITGSHHEKWDGSGYPDGLSGEAIPLPARLMALADVYDALTCKRIYKSAMSHEDAKQVIVEARGTHFDPAVVDAFLRREREFEAIARELREEHSGEVAA
jgi:putative two-component system response regulator